MSVRPTDHVDISTVDAATRVAVLALFVEGYRRADQIAEQLVLSVPAVETVLDVYGGKAHRDRLRVSLEELRATAPEEPAAVPEPSAPRARKWTPGPDGTYACPDCRRAFPTPQGVGRHHASMHPAPAVEEAAEPEETPKAPEPPVEPQAPAVAAEPDPIPEEDDTAMPDDDVDDAAPDAPAAAEVVALDEVQQRRVLAITEARKVLEHKRAASIFTTQGASELGVPVTDLLRVACWIEGGEVLPEFSDDARSSMTTRNVQTLLKAEADLISLGYERGHARAMVERLVDRLAELDRIQAREAAGVSS